MNMRELMTIAEGGPAQFLAATPENIARAKEFVFKKWVERAHELGKDAPIDLSSSCKFTSMFAKAVFGGHLEGNYDHQFVRLPNGEVLDLNLDAADVKALGIDAHEHDEDFWNNDDHRDSMDSCRPRVNAWVREFLNGSLTEAGLQGIKKHQNAPGLTTKHAVIAYMMKQGYELLGAGEYGAVFDHPSFGGKYVLKLFSDPGYEYFVEYCRTQQQNPNLPKFFGKMIRVSERGRMIRMERLYTPANTFDPDIREACVMAQRVAFEDMDEAEAEKIVATWAPRHQNLYRTALEVCMIVPGNDSKNIDLLGNVMERKDGDTLVITDPYAIDDFRM